MKQAIILAGGKGTRLFERLNGLPKPMIDICGIPLIERQILLLKKFHFTQIIILVNYEAEKIIKYCNQNNNWGININCIEDGEPLGTAGATLKIFDLLMDEFLVVYGDTMFDVDLDKFLFFHRIQSNVSVTLFLHPNDHPSDSDLVEIDEFEKVINFYPYPHDKQKYYPNLVNAALYWVNKKCLYKWGKKLEYLDFGKDLFPQMLDMGYIIRGYRSSEYIKDCGTPSRLDKVCQDFLNGKIERSKLNNKSKAIFLDRDGTINKEVNHLNNVDQFELVDQAANAIRNFNLNEFITCVVTNQPVVARGECDIFTLRSIHNKLETLIGQEGAYIDRIYYCPHHPDSGFLNEIKELKFKCDCRKPNQGMIIQATSDFNIELNESWLIGDSTTDILTATKAGIKSILVETGYAGLDNKYLVTPDFVCPDLYSASLFITDHYKIIYEYCNLIFSNFKKGDVVKIGGFSRSGKSTFASVLKFYLNDHGHKTHIISLDRWIKSKDNRQDTVFGRYDIDSINELLGKITTSNRQHLKLNLPFYNKKNNENIPNVELLEITPDDIIIIEGTIIFEVGKNQNTKDFFVSINEDIRKQRLIKEYIKRGVNLDNAFEIYNSRMIDECSFIQRKTFMNSNAHEINLENIFTNKKRYGN
jgi:histidinol-phosphate phosphatase family protein